MLPTTLVAEAGYRIEWELPKPLLLQSPIPGDSLSGAFFLCLPLRAPLWTFLIAVLLYMAQNSPRKLLTLTLEI